MRSVLTGFFCIFSLMSLRAQQTSIIPLPVEVIQGKGSFVIKPEMAVYSSFSGEEWKSLYAYFTAELKKRFNIRLVNADSKTNAELVFELKRMPTSGKPAYQLEVNNRQVIVSSNFHAPAFHAIQSLFQLMANAKNRELESVKIFDHARFSHRGMHLDVARHFFPVSFVKKYIDYLAAYKFNRFHWHLTDDQGWRIEIKKFPLLTALGANRNGTIIGRYPGKGNDNISYGGFYTQEEIREVVLYAKERYIEVIPEIEMPGHASAAIAAYPWLSCFPGKPTVVDNNMISETSRKEQEKGRIKLVQETWGVFDDVFCAGNDSTLLFLQQVLDEVVPLFPYKYVHIGGDESPRTHWKACPKCQNRIKNEKLKDEHELQSWFVQKMEKYLNARGKIIIGWDEILEGGLAPNAVVMSWRGEQGGIDAARQKHDVIMSPGNPLYFDHSQSKNEDSVTIGGYNPIEQVYAYNPIPKELSADEHPYILGGQANLWTEYIDNPKKVEYMIFPRMLALSEVLWNTRQTKAWEEFEKRMIDHFKYLEKQNINYSKAFFDLKASVIPGADNKSVIWKLQSKYAKAICEYCYIHAEKSVRLQRDTVYYDTVPRTLPNDVSKVTSYIVTKNEKKAGEYLRIVSPPYYDTSLLLKIDQSITANAWQHFHHTKGGMISQPFIFTKSTGKKITLIREPSAKYPGDGAFTLVNGVQNKSGLTRRDEFLGFEGTDCEVIIDLGSKTNFHMVIVNTLTETGSWIYPPKDADFTVSDDGVHFHSPGNIFSDIEPYMDRKTRLHSLQDEYSGRYIKVYIKNYGKIPQGKPGAGNPAWLFVDEIEVY